MTRRSLFLALGASLAAPAFAQRGRWELLGSARVDGAADHDSIAVGVRDGKFRAIQFRINGGAIQFSRVVVHYGDGEPEELQIRDRIRSGGKTRAIDLRGRTRFIRNVELWYGKANWRSRPELQLYGMR